ncbi:unnamed protein product [Polarella glacialis]|uniref:Uncharacterized protein n=1 Tax=Polarella glacialis TaxID=89957 RepID=A0A813LUT5_POLGL|nr:unnamed protein product [Polarella glacialis]
MLLMLLLFLKAFGYCRRPLCGAGLKVKDLTFHAKHIWIRVFGLDMDRSSKWKATALDPSEGVGGLFSVLLMLLLLLLFWLLFLFFFCSFLLLCLFLFLFLFWF